MKLLFDPKQSCWSMTEKVPEKFIEKISDLLENSNYDYLKDQKASYSENLFQDVVKEDLLFKVHSSKSSFCKLYGINPSNFSKFIKDGKNSKIKENLTEFYENNLEEERWKKLNLLSNSELKKKNKYICYGQDGRLSLTTELNEKLKFDFTSYFNNLVISKVYGKQ
jgi:hypothetical protein